MDIEGELGRLRAEREAEGAAAALRSRMAGSAWSAAREAFGAFRTALTDQGIPPVQVVRVDYGYVPGRKGFLRWIPERHTYKAQATDLNGWLFRGMLILTDGRIMKDPSSQDQFDSEKRWGPGRIASVSIPRGREHSENIQAEYRAKSAEARKALQAAGLGGEISSSHLYIPADRNPEEITCVPEETVREGTRNAVEFRLAHEQFALYPDGHLEMRPDLYETATYSLERFFAEYIEAAKTRLKEQA